MLEDQELKAIDDFRFGSRIPSRAGRARIGRRRGPRPSASWTARAVLASSDVRGDRVAVLPDSLCAGRRQAGSAPPMAERPTQSRVSARRSASVQPWRPDARTGRFPNAELLAERGIPLSVGSSTMRRESCCEAARRIPELPDDIGDESAAGATGRCPCARRPCRPCNSPRSACLLRGMHESRCSVTSRRARSRLGSTPAGAKWTSCRAASCRGGCASCRVDLSEMAPAASAPKPASRIPLDVPRRVFVVSWRVPQSSLSDFACALAQFHPMTRSPCATSSMCICPQIYAVDMQLLGA